MIESGKEKGFRRMAVAGAGAAGISAAICAAKRGLRVDLIEAGAEPGGTAVNGILHTLAGFFDLDGRPIDSEICLELCDRLKAFTQKRKIGKFWVLQVEPQVYRRTLTQWLAEFPEIHYHSSSRFLRLSIRDRSIDFAEAGGKKIWQILGSQTAFVDATGEGALASLAHQADTGPADSWSINFRFIVDNLASGDRAVRAAVKLELESVWPIPDCSLWLDSGLSAGEIFLKTNFSGPKGSATQTAAAVEKCLPEVLSRLPRLSAFRNLAAGQLVRRGGGRLKSRAAPVALDAEKSFPVAWPFEIWNGSQVRLEMPEKIPFRLSENFLKSAQVGNLFAAGKCAGIPDKELSAARVVGGCWAMGEQVAKMAAREES